MASDSQTSGKRPACRTRYAERFGNVLPFTVPDLYAPRAASSVVFVAFVASVVVVVVFVFVFVDARMTSRRSVSFVFGTGGNLALSNVPEYDDDDDDAEEVDDGGTDATISSLPLSYFISSPRPNMWWVRASASMRRRWTYSDTERATNVTDGAWRRIETTGKSIPGCAPEPAGQRRSPRTCSGSVGEVASGMRKGNRPAWDEGGVKVPPSRSVRMRRRAGRWRGIDVQATSERKWLVC